MPDSELHVGGTEMLDDLANLRIFQEYRREGREEGMEEILMELVRKRFPSLDKLASEQTPSIHSPEILKDLAVKIATVRSAKEARRYLKEWEEIYKDQIHQAE
ncbi:MAG TPA: hypothetical protein VKR06_32520 [Ktedonosporobacter sp.]|nr:hypothetical protein [Ktedonosporobacter sp.]